MCGIVGYLGNRPAKPILIEGLRRLEYRGYDSAGLATISKKGIVITKTKGRVEDLAKKVSKDKTTSTIGIGHTRWATHGLPNDTNAHPHLSSDGRVAIVHNGIIENYALIKEDLVKKGFVFKSQTDTEVLANLIASVLKEQNLGIFDAVQAALQIVRGAYAIAVLDNTDPDKLIVAKKSSPLVIGISDQEFIVGSDATPIVAHTQKVIYINDNEVAELQRDGKYSIVSLNGEKVNPLIHKLEINIEKLEKNGYGHYMVKEIFEQPEAIENTMRGRLSLDQQTIMLGGIIDYEQRILRAQKLTIVACGTSYHAGLVGKYLIEELANIPVEVVYSSEFRYRKSPISDRDVVIAISQSGETADTLAAVELANRNNALTLGIVNNVGSTIARATQAGIYTHAGPEISVASTKAFSAQVTALTLMALRFAQQLGTMPKSTLQEIYSNLANLPLWVETTLKETTSTAKTIANIIARQDLVIFLGRNICYPVALEGALKLKEITYISAEGYPAGELKHGPIALIKKNTPVFVIVPTNPELRDKLLSGIQEVKARGAYIIAIGSRDEKIANQVNKFFVIPGVPDIMLPIIANIPLQLVAYYSALKLNYDVDKPRNLAKSVTVE